MKGRLIVLEGTDGSGKSTQFARLCQRAQEAAALYGWQTVPCLDGAGNLRSIDEIHQAIWQAAEPLLYGKER